MAARPAKDRDTTRLRGALVLSVVLHLVLVVVVELLPVREAGEKQAAQRLAVTMERSTSNGGGRSKPAPDPAEDRDSRVAAGRSLPEVVTKEAAESFAPQVRERTADSADSGESRAARETAPEQGRTHEVADTGTPDTHSSAETAPDGAPPGATGAENRPLSNGVHVDAVVADLYRRLQDHLVYPMAARRRSFEGTVTVTIEVQADGTLGSHEVAGSSGYAVLDRAALESLQRVFPIVHSAGRPLLITVRIQYSLI